MTSNVKVGGAWKTNATPYVKVGGTWKVPKAGHVKVGGGWKHWFLQGGVTDYPFCNSICRATAPVGKFLIQSDGKFVVAGTFTAWNGTSANRLVRLNTDGTVDTSFVTNLGTGPSSSVNSIALQSDGKIIVSGAFTTWDGTTVNRIVRLNTDGTRDTTFTTNVNAAANGDINAVYVQSDDKILVGGAFTTWNSSASYAYIVRLNSDGTRDTAFTANTTTYASSTVHSFAVQSSDSKIVVGGAFTTWNAVTVNRIVRLNSDGTRDTAFTTSAGTAATTAGSYITALTIQSDGKILVGGTFTAWSGSTVGYMVRLNSTGARDTGLSIGTGANGNITSIALQSDGKIIVTGNFTTWAGTTVGYIVRLSTAGARDTTFSTNIGTGSRATINLATVQSDDKIIISSSSPLWDTSFTSYFVRLNSDGTMPSYSGISGVLSGGVGTAGAGGTNSIAVNASAVQTDDKVILGGLFTLWNGVTVGGIVRLNADGTRDTAFTTNAGAGTGGGQFLSIYMQSDGKFIIGGNFTNYGATGVRRIARIQSSGAIDTGFTVEGTGPNTTVSTVYSLSDGSVLVGGQFTTWNSVTVNRIAKLNSSGTRDTTFTTNASTAANGNINSIDVQSDGKIIVGGAFTTWISTTVNGIVRLNSDGTRDTTFTTNVGTATGGTTINRVKVLSDDKILVGGQFTSWNGSSSYQYIMKLNADGTRDTTFTGNTGSSPNNNVSSFGIQADGKILVGGSFTTWSGTTVGPIVRLNSDGTRDTAFTTNVNPVGTVTNAVTNIAIQSDKKITLTGAFNTWNNIYQGGIVRIGGDIAV